MLLTLSLAVLCILLVFILPALKETPFGRCGERLFWHFDPDTGILTIEGSGDMTDYDYSTTWSRFYADAITSISLPYRLTSIGSGAFERCSSLTSVTV